MEKNFMGYSGKILRIDLSSGRIFISKKNEKFYRMFLGGNGFIAYFLLKEIQPCIDPLGPENKLIFALGPFTGTTVIASGRNAVGAKSPLTGGIAFSHVGEFWGAELKKAGYDALIIEGKAKTPVYVVINDDEVKICQAKYLWGKSTKETQQIIRTKMGDQKIRVAMIGQAGENMVNYACIMNGCYNAAGRGGLGAVMGSKNLKAIAVKGSEVPLVANHNNIRNLNKSLFKKMRETIPTKNWIEFGTGGQEMIDYEASGQLPIRNWRDGVFPGVKKIHAGVMKDTVRIGMNACFGCPMKCKKKIGFEEPYKVDPAYGGPEYESISAFGNNLGIDNMEALIKANELCNAYGLDTISTGGTIAFAMECFERGLLTTEDTDGLNLTWGNYDVMIKCIELIAQKKNFGKLLALGTARLSQRIGRGSQDFAMHVKGLDAGHHEPRTMAGLGLGFMVNPHGADHCCNVLDLKFESDSGIASRNYLGFLDKIKGTDAGPQKVALFRIEQLKQVIYDSLLVCHLAYVPVNFEEIAALTTAVTGWETSSVELIRIGERILTMARLFNIREGFTAEDDRLPERYYQPKRDGVLAKNATLFKEKMEKAKEYYYVLMGWDNNGIPCTAKIEELGIQRF